MSSPSDRQGALHYREYPTPGKISVAATKPLATQRLTDEEQVRLGLIVQEDHGRGLSRRQFEDCVAQLLEDVPGFETPGTKEVGLLVERLWAAYQKP